MERKEAIALGLKLYNTGRPCSKGHFSPRYTNTGACRDCIKGYASDTRARLNQQIATQRVQRITMVHVNDLDAFDAMVSIIECQRQSILAAEKAEHDRQFEAELASKFKRPINSVTTRSE